MAKRKKKLRISRSKLISLIVTFILTITLIMTRYYLGKTITYDWEFILDIINYLIVVFSVGIIYFILNLFKIKPLKNGK